MKRNFLYTVLGVVCMLFFNSCDKTEGALYSDAPNKASFLANVASLKMDGQPLQIPVVRTSTSGEFTLPITLTSTGVGYTNVFSIAEPVVFADGSAKTYAKVAYGDISGIDASTLSVTPNNGDATVGLAFPVDLTIGNQFASATNIKKVSVLASKVLEFQSLGNVRVDSELGWEEDDNVQVELQKAVGANVYKLVKPFGNFSIAFMIKSDGKTVVFPDQVILYANATYGNITMSKVTGKLENNVVTLTVGGYNTANGLSYGGGVEKIYLPI